MLGNLRKEQKNNIIGPLIRLPLLLNIFCMTIIKGQIITSNRDVPSDNVQYQLDNIGFPLNKSFDNFGSFKGRSEG